MDLAQARRHSVLCEFIRPHQSHEDVGDFDAEAMADRIVYLERILHALREPSEGTLMAVLTAIYTRATLTDIIHATVAAAEQEVGDA